MYSKYMSTTYSKYMSTTYSKYMFTMYSKYISSDKLYIYNILSSSNTIYLQHPLKSISAFAG